MNMNWRWVPVGNDRVLALAIGASIVLHGIVLAVHFKLPERLLSRAAEMANPPRSIAVKPLSAPDSLPMGVRAPPTITDPGMAGLPVLALRCSLSGYCYFFFLGM